MGNEIKKVQTNMHMEFISGHVNGEWSARDKVIGDGKTSEAIVIPPACNIGVSVIVSGGDSAKIQFSRSPRKILLEDGRQLLSE